MMRYTWKRILTGIVSLFLLATVTFFLVRLIPGSPFQRGGVSEQVVEAVEEEYGLNDPLIEQYLSYMGNLLKGDLGISYQDPGTSVEDNSVAVEIYNRWDGPIARVTTCLCDHSLAEDEAYVDTNNCPWAVALLEENGFAERTGRTRRSGYCEYPAMKFDRSKMAEFEEES